MDVIVLDRRDGVWYVDAATSPLLDKAGSNRVSLTVAEMCGLYAADEIECNICKHRWTAVHPYAGWLQCPACKNMVEVV